MSSPALVLDTDVILAGLVGFAASRVRRSMLSGQSGKLRAVAKAVQGPPEGGSPVGRAISDDLRRLQSQVQRRVNAEPIIAALLPAIAALAEVGRLVSITATRDGRSVRMSVLDGKEWIEFYAEDEDAAAAIGEGVAAAFTSR